MTGRPRPTALKIIEGNPGKRPLNKAEPMPERGMPACPVWLDSGARREWRKVAPHLEKLGLLTLLDGAALACYCQAMSNLAAAQKVLRVKGNTVRTPSGYIQQRPEVTIVQRNMALVRAFCGEFGFTPASRGRMTMPGSDEGLDMDAILS